MLSASKDISTQRASPPSADELPPRSALALPGWLGRSTDRHEADICLVLSALHWQGVPRLVVALQRILRRMLHKL
jgi:hypothetical protein